MHSNVSKAFKVYAMEYALLYLHFWVVTQIVMRADDLPTLLMTKCHIATCFMTLVLNTRGVLLGYLQCIL